jgi:glycosyltransferase involved in cell wall biosynthesis
MTVVTDRFDDRALRSVNAIQVENPWMLEYAKRVTAGLDINVRYAHPGIDADLFRPAEGRLSSADPYILCVGRLNDPRKNIELLLRAYSGISEELRARVRLVLAGASSPEPSFWQKAQDLGLGGRIQFVACPSQKELVRLYQRARAFALSSDEEGLGIVLLEAMACGVPVISTRSGGPDGVITDGDDGYLVPLDDAVALAERIATVCLDPELNERIGRRGRATIERRYAKPVAADSFLEIWDNLLQSERRAGPSTGNR